MQVAVAKTPVANAHPHPESDIQARSNHEDKRSIIQPIAIICGIGGTLGHIR